jgi:pimeloyl-ACP methyl ester carboxylesterase
MRCCFAPQAEGPFQLAVIAHATTQNVLRRATNAAAGISRTRKLSGGPRLRRAGAERPGHGATGGKYLEDQGGCDEADYARSGRATADEIAAAVNFMRRQPFIKQDRVVIVGHSAGRWGALALAGQTDVSAIIVFAAGRGGRANDFPNQVCAPHTLKAAAAEFGKGSRVRVTWLVRGQ